MQNPNPTNTQQPITQTQQPTTTTQEQQVKPTETQQQTTQPQKPVEEPKKHVPAPADTHVYEDAAKHTAHKETDISNIPSDIKTLEGEFLKKEREYLQKSLDFLNRLTLTNKDNIEQEKKEVAEIEAELKKLEPGHKQASDLVAAAKKSLDEAEQKITAAKTLSQDLARKRDEAIGKLNAKDLAGLKIKDKTQINDLFAFLNETAYGASTKYTWSTFKKQALGKEAPAFFSKLKALNYTAPLTVNTTLLQTAINNKATSLTEFEKKGKENPQLRALYDYIQTIQDANQNLGQITAREQEFAHVKQEFDQKTFALQQASTAFHAVEEKLVLYKKYEVALQQVNVVVENTIKATEEKIEENNILAGQESPKKDEKVDAQRESPIKGEPAKDTHTSPKKEVRNSQGVEFTESPSAERKEGGACEGCNIF